MSRCGKVTGQERFSTDDPWEPVVCLLPPGHEGEEHADWSAWLGVTDPDFTRPGRSLHDPVDPIVLQGGRRVAFAATEDGARSLAAAELARRGTCAPWPLYLTDASWRAWNAGLPLPVTPA